MSPRPEAVLFDLDGTLADTAPDLAASLNRTLAAHGRQPLPYANIRPVVSHGGIALIKLGFGLPREHEEFEPLRRYLLDDYAANLHVDTRLFEGMAGVLSWLEAEAIAWGIVTNKPAWLTDPLVDSMGLRNRASCVVSGDTCAERKPHPAPILHACDLAGCAASSAWYIGDAGRDMQAGNAAGCTTVAALYGYLHPEDPPRSWRYDAAISSPMDLMDLLTGAGKR